MATTSVGISIESKYKFKAIASIGDPVILRNGHRGTVKCIDNESGLYGIELIQIHINGNNGKGHFKCKPQHGFFTKHIVTKLNDDKTLFLKDKNDTIQFLTKVENKEIRKKQKELSTFGYIRDIHKFIQDEFFTIIPHDVIQLCIQYNSYDPQVDDTIKLKSGETKRIWSIGYSIKTNTFYFGIHSTDKNLLNFITLQEIQCMIPIDYNLHKFAIGEAVKYNNFPAKVKFIGTIDGFGRLIGIEFDNMPKVNNCHSGNGHFECSKAGAGIFLRPRSIESMLEVELERLPQYAEMCHSQDITIKLHALRKIRKITIATDIQDQPLQKIMDLGVIISPFLVF